MANLAKTDITAIAETTGFDQDLALLFHAQYCDKATGVEFRDFLQKSKDFECDPRKGEIYFIKYSANQPGTCFIGKNGFVKNAVAHPQMDGIDQGIDLDESGSLVSAWCEIHRKDWKRPARVIVYREEYDTKKGNWSKMPKTMLQKVAISQACRLAFPDRFNGVLDIAEADPMDDTSEPISVARRGVSGLKRTISDPIDIEPTPEPEKESESEQAPTDPASEFDIEQFFSHCAGKSVELTEAEVDEIEPGIEKARLNSIFKVAQGRKEAGE